MRRGGNNFNYFSESLISILTCRRVSFTPLALSRKNVSGLHYVIQAGKKLEPRDLCYKVNFTPWCSLNDIYIF